MDDAYNTGDGNVFSGATVDNNDKVRFDEAIENSEEM